MICVSTAKDPVIMHIVSQVVLAVGSQLRPVPCAETLK